MPRLLILKLDDGDAIGEKLSKEMGGFVEPVEVKSLYDFYPSDGLTGCVTVVILTSLVCQEIRRIHKDTWEKILVHNKNTIILVYCRQGEDIFRDFCKSLGVEETALQIYNIYKEPTQWYTAESQIKIMLSMLDNRQSTVDIVPKERRFVIKPNVITKGTKEVTLVLFEDYPNIQSLSAQVTNTTSGDRENPKVKRLRNGVWVLDTSGLKSGENTVELLVENEHIGEETLTVKSELEVVKEALGKAMSSDSKKLMAQLLQIKEDCFDEDIADILGESSSYLFQKLFQAMIDLASHDQKDTTNIFHFFAKNGCTRSIEVAKRNLTNSKRLCSELNQEGDAPLDVAKKHGHIETERTLVADCNEEKFENTTSPLAADWAYRRAHTIIPRNKGTALPNRDSGVSTGSNFGSDGRLEQHRSSFRPASDSDMPLASTTTQTPSPHRFRFPTRTPHLYDEIEEPSPTFIRL